MESSSFVSNLNELLVHVEGLRKRFGHEIWWRGQADTAWRLTPAVFRHGRTPVDESGLVTRFQSKAPVRYSPCPNRDDPAAWLFLMQHYRLPTRLLDWTQSPLAALFFAVDQEPEKSGAVWALNPYELNNKQWDEYKLFSASVPHVSGLLPSALTGNTDSSEKVASVMPREIDIRMLTQQSVFTLHGHSSAVDELPECKAFLAKYEVPSISKEELHRALDSLGVNRASLFPDLENLARDLSGRRYWEHRKVTMEVDTKPD